MAAAGNNAAPALDLPPAADADADADAASTTAAAAAAAAALAAQYPVETLSPPLARFFSQRCMPSCGLPVLAHACVAPAALHEACRRVDAALASLPAVAARLRRLGASVQLIGASQPCSALPQYAHVRADAAACAAFDARGRGYGGLCPSAGEENLLRRPCDRYKDHRDILSHELSHTIMDWGFPPLATAALRARVESVRLASLAAGRWEGAYAGTCASEFFAEAAMWHLGSRGDAGRMVNPPVTEGRVWLQAHDPDAAALLAAVFAGAFPARSGDGGAAEEEEEEDAIWELEREADAATRSVDAVAPAAAMLLVVNDTASEIALTWVNGGGERVPYATVAPGAIAGQATWAGHAWHLHTRTLNGDGGGEERSMGVFVARAGTCRVRLQEGDTDDAVGDADVVDAAAVSVEGGVQAVVAPRAGARRGRARHGGGADGERRAQPRRRCRGGGGDGSDDA
jgi:hypothetical protein